MFRKILIPTAILMALVLATGGWFYYQVFHKKIAPKNEQGCPMYVYPETTWAELHQTLQDCFGIKENFIFEHLVRYKNLPETFKPGHYRFDKPLSANSLVNKLKSGQQNPVKVVFNSVRNLSELAGIVGNQMMFDSLQLIQMLKDPATVQDYGFSGENLATMFIPNTYEVYWTMSVNDFVRRMNSEYKKFWSQQRVEKAKKLNLSPIEVSILASIVEKETAVRSEMPVVAGVYLNRLRIRMPLQADPTVVFASGDFGARRVTNKMSAIDSPYNTYKKQGLPPGPICIPASFSIDAVLNYQMHDYLYFCASPKMDGTHIFAKTLRQHNQNAEEYRRMLNKMRIYR